MLQSIKSTRRFKPTVSQRFAVGEIIHFPLHPIYGDGTLETYRWDGCKCFATRTFKDGKAKTSFIHCKEHSGTPKGLPVATFESLSEPHIKNVEDLFSKGGFIRFGKKPLVKDPTNVCTAPKGYRLDGLIEIWKVGTCGCDGAREFSSTHQGIVDWRCCDKHADAHTGAPKGPVTLTFEPILDALTNGNAESPVN